MIFTVSNQIINYLYNASGVKVEKQVTNGTNIKTTQYLDGFQYVNGDLSFFPHAEGYVRINGNPTKTKYWYDYVYNYTDHLEGGELKKIPVEIFSERASLPRWDYLSYTKDRLTGELKELEEIEFTRFANTPKIKNNSERNHYYPFGLEHHNYNQAKYDISLVKDIDDTFVIARNAVDYKYKYNGKELQDDLGLNVYALDWRNYDPAIGRFNTQDVLSELAPTMTPYRYAFNNPVHWSDPTGLFETTWDGWVSGTDNTVFWDPDVDNQDDVDRLHPGGEYLPDGTTFVTNRGKTLVLNDDGTTSDAGELSATVAQGKSNSGSILPWIIWGVNTSVGIASTYTVYKGEYLLSNELWRYQPYGKQKIITPWSKTANGRSYWNNNFAKAAREAQANKVSKIRGVSSKLTKSGGVLLVADVALSGELKPSHIINGAMLGASTTGVGAIVAGVWFIADFGTMGANYLINGEAKGIGDMIDESVGTLKLYDGVY